MDMENTTRSLRSLFEAALALPPDARAAYLAARCADPDTRARIEGLLAADAGAGEPLGQASAEQLARDIGEVDEGVALTPGARIGPFELLEVLGEGGSSTVFRAQRETDGVTQQVALKLLHRNLHAPDAQRRFRAERKVLAQLQHPGIARLIEGGVTDDGLGYIALELVDGVPITEYARNHKLNLRARLRLFVQACAAVAASHRALIVHRDLKPSNVLVTEDSEVKLLDFGIAKLLDDDTLTAVPAFTPAYAAPEQRDGGPISTATDVYALGVLLGELITGKRLDGSAGHTPSGQIAENTEPGVLPAPAHITRRQLRGDLDTIVLKAIETEPERRYASASALADDVNRLLIGQPVSAHPPTRWYRTRKFVSRHKGGVATTAAFLLAIFAALGLALWQADVARSEAQRANSVRDFLLSVFNAAKPAGPRLAPPSVVDVVRAGVSEAQHSPLLDREVRVELVSTLGTVLREQGAVDESLSLLADNYGDALREFGADHAATLRAGSALSRAQIDGAEYGEARILLDQLVSQSRHRSKRNLRARLLATSAALHSHQAEHESALRQSKAAMSLCRRGCDLQTGSFVALERGSTLANAHNDAAAIAPMEKALALQRQLHGGPHVDIADILQQLSRAQRRLRHMDRAEALARESLTIVEASVPNPHILRSDAMDTLRQVLIDSYQLDEAIVLGERIIAMDEATLGKGHPALATSHNTQGFTYGWMGDYARSAKEHRAALKISEPIADNARRTALYRSNLGAAIGMTDPAAGIALLRQAIAEQRSLAEPDLSEIAAELEKLGVIQRRIGDLAGSEASFRESQAIYHQHYPDAPKAWIAFSQMGLGRTLAAAGKNDEAARHLREAIALLGPPDHPSNTRAEAKLTLATILHAQGDPASARAMLDDARAELQQIGFVKPTTEKLLTDAAAQIDAPAD